MKPTAKLYRVPSTRVRDTLVILGGVVAALLIVWGAVTYMGRGVTGNILTGTITKKEFQPLPEPEQEFTIGRGGTLSAERIEGDYLFEVRVPEGEGFKEYYVWVNKKIYNAKAVGDPYAFPRPLPAK